MVIVKAQCDLVRFGGKAVLELNDSNVVKTMENGNFMLMFYAEWCPLVPPIFEILNELEQQEGECFQFAKIHFDFCPEAVKYYGIPGVPTVLAIKNGVVLRGWAGLTDAVAYRNIVGEIFQ